jgi:hypothetical protein
VLYCRVKCLCIPNHLNTISHRNHLKRDLMSSHEKEKRIKEKNRHEESFQGNRIMMCSLIPWFVLNAVNTRDESVIESLSSLIISRIQEDGLSGFSLIHSSKKSLDEDNDDDRESLCKYLPLFLFLLWLFSFFSSEQCFITIRVIRCCLTHSRDRCLSLVYYRRQIQRNNNQSPKREAASSSILHVVHI